MLGSPYILGLVLKYLADNDSNTNIATSSDVEKIFTVFQWLQGIQFLSGYYYAFVNQANSPKWWPSWVNVGPHIHFVLFIVYDMVICTFLKACCLAAFWRSIKASGFSHFFMFCVLLQVTFVVMVIY